MSINAHRFGFCDGIFNRPCCSPWEQSYRHMREKAQYLKGYMEGNAARLKFAITTASNLEKN